MNPLKTNNGYSHIIRGSINVPVRLEVGVAVAHRLEGGRLKVVQLEVEH